LCGAAEKINEVLRFKSNMDSGMFLPLQLAAAKALSLPEAWYDSVNAVYKKRRVRVIELLDKLNCTYSLQQAGMFMWAKIPPGYEDAYTLADKILYDFNVFVTPGGIFGNGGENYIRISLCATEEKISEAIERIKW
jgi:aspartate/methionine/tyrosine aminotransferase